MTDPIGSESVRHPLGRRRFMAVIAGGLLAARFGPVAAQQPKRPWRIGIFNAGSPHPEVVKAQEQLRQELNGLGDVEGQNVVYEVRWADGQAEQLPEIANEFARMNVDLVVALGTAQALAMRKVSSTIPIVVMAATLPVESGLVAGLAHPGANVTGTTMDAGSEEMAKRLQLFQEVVPSGLPIAAIYSSSYPGVTVYVQQVQDAARQLKLRLEAVDVPNRDVDAISLIRSSKIGGLLVGLDPVVATQWKRIVEVAIQKRWPTMLAGVVARAFVRAGGLMCYSPNNQELWRRIAAQVHKILKGAKPGDLPMEQPTQFDLVVNLKTAKAIGSAIPQSLLARANEVIE